jgi:hypothetical protein
MKKIALIILLCSACSLAQAQFANTKWTGTLNLPDPAGVMLDFKKDVVDVVLDQSGEVLETMSFTIKADTIFLKKVTGQSVCSEQSIAKLKFRVADNKLSLTPISDDCQQRAEAWSKDPFTKAKE